MSSVSISPISHRDEEWIVFAAREMHHETELYRHIHFDPGSVRAHVHNAILDPHTRCIVSRKDGVPTGFVLGSLSPFLFSPALALSENALYVLPHYRGGPSALRLLRGLIDWGRAKGAVEFFWSPTNTTGRDFAPLAKRLGMKVAGAKFYTGLERLAA